VDAEELKRSTAGIDHQAWGKGREEKAQQKEEGCRGHHCPTIQELWPARGRNTYSVGRGAAKDGEERRMEDGHTEGRGGPKGRGGIRLDKLGGQKTTLRKNSNLKMCGRELKKIVKKKPRGRHQKIRAEFMGSSYAANNNHKGNLFDNLGRKRIFPYKLGEGREGPPGKLR